MDSPTGIGGDALETTFSFEGDSYVYHVCRLARPKRAIVQKTSSPTTIGGGKWSRKAAAVDSSTLETTFTFEGTT